LFKAVESLKLKVNKALLFFCEAHFRPFPPQSNSRAFLLVDIMKHKKLVYGVGTNDADYVVSKKETIGYEGGKQRFKLIWACPYYSTWASMLSRCYSAKAQDKRPTYRDCTVSEEWRTFSNFKEWMEKQEWKGLQLDKDLLIEGNKIYSPETCVFVTLMVNSFILDCRAARGDWQIGASWDKIKNKFQSTCRNPFTKKLEKLGYFDCEQEAHNAWSKRKLELARELASIQTNPRVAKALFDRYSKL
jgi:hypothetical protein